MEYTGGTATLSVILGTHPGRMRVFRRCAGGVNDPAPVLKELFYRLLAARVNQGRGTSHFRTPVESGLETKDQRMGLVSLISSLPSAGDSCRVQEQDKTP